MKRSNPSSPIVNAKGRSSEAPALRIGVDGDALRTPLSGVGHYVYHLARELEREFPQETRFFAYSRFPAEKLALPSERWVIRSEHHAAAMRLPSFVWLKTRGAELCVRDEIDLFWATRTLHPRLELPVRTVCTVHDLNHLLVPETMQLPTLWSHRAWFRGDLAHAQHVVANSTGTAERLRMLLHRAVDGVVTPGLDGTFAAQTRSDARQRTRELMKFGVCPPYILAVSTLEPRKNLGSLLEAYMELKRQGELPRYSLVLVGTSGWKNRQLDEALRAGASCGVVRTGYVPDSLLPTLYGSAELFVLPSIYEGFGMPVLEARACGTRIVVSDTPELRAVGGPNAVLVKPTPAGVRDGIRLALAAPKRAELGLAEDYSWSRSAKRLATIFENALRTQGGHHDRKHHGDAALRYHLHA